MQLQGLPGFHPEGIILGGKLQEMGVVLYTFLYNCPKFWGGSFPPPAPPPPLDETLLADHGTETIQQTVKIRILASNSLSM